MKNTKRKLAALASIGLVSMSAATVLINGCKGGGGSSMQGLTGMLSGGNSGGGGGDQNASSGGSGNPLVDAASGFAPKGTGGYIQSGYMLGSAMGISEKDEDQMGRSVAVGITNTYPVSDNQAINDYVALVGTTVAEASGRPDGQFYFGVLDTPEVGAYSGPDGYIMITRGAIEKMQDESELAGVLGHEIAHVCHEDGLNAMKTSKFAGAFAKAANTAMSNATNSPEQNGFADNLVDGVLTKPYGRDQELSADAEAVKYVAAAGYDPNGYLHFVQRIAALQAAGGNKLFATHPDFADRIKVVSDAIAKTGQGGTGATNQARFQATTGAHG